MLLFLWAGFVFSWSLNCRLKARRFGRSTTVRSDLAFSGSVTYCSSSVYRCCHLPCVWHRFLMVALGIAMVLVTWHLSATSPICSWGNFDFHSFLLALFCIYITLSWALWVTNLTTSRICFPQCHAFRWIEQSPCHLRWSPYTLLWTTVFTFSAVSGYTIFPPLTWIYPKMWRRDRCLPCTVPSVIGFARSFTCSYFEPDLALGNPFCSSEELF